MAKRTVGRSVKRASIPAREAVQVASDCITAITGRQTTQITGIKRHDEGGWIAEVEVVEVPRIPPSADLLGLYEIQLDEGGELRGCRRTGRYRRGQALHEQTTVNADITVNADTCPNGDTSPAQDTGLEG